MNSFGRRFIFTTFGESHGKAVGCVVDGVPANLVIDEAYIQSELDRRRPGQNIYSTQRKEPDRVEILSGVFEGRSTGTPIAMVIFNKDQKSRDYNDIMHLFRPGHADYTYFEKYGIRDYRGGGRSSARETAARVAAGAIAKLMLKELGITCESGVCEIAGIKAKQHDFAFARDSEIYALDRETETAQKEAIDKARHEHDSCGGAALVKISNVPVGLGEPLYYKLDSLLADALMGINAVKAVEIGDGMQSSRLHGSENNDQMNTQGFLSNHAGGVLGGISNGNAIIAKAYFKPTPSIFSPQKTLTEEGREVEFELKGRHDPCVAVRGSVVCESMTAIVVADLLLLNLGRNMQGLQAYYSNS